ncbi:MAG TPA: hypothetical protein VLV83_22530 [Acidobacteriota bacterium]|nr:hypothetical protein [Acidobacteriota bacterium]
MSKNQRWIVVFVFLLTLATTGTLSAQPTGTPVEALTLGRVIAGDLPGGVLASTEILLTNRDPQQSSCAALVIFNTGSTASTGAVLFNGDERPANIFETSIPRGGARKITLTAPSGFAEGAVLIAPLMPCNQDSISGTARFTLETAGALNELYTIAPNTPDKWLADGRCVAISTCLRRTPSTGFGNDLGIATTGVIPQLAAPEGSTMSIEVFDSEGQSLGASTRPVTSQHQAFFPLANFPSLSDGTVTLILCLFTQDPAYRLDLTTIQVGTDSQGGVQFDAPIFADGFESGDVSAWTNQQP